MDGLVGMVNAVSVVVTSKCLALSNRPSTQPTRSPMAFFPRWSPLGKSAMW